MCACVCVCVRASMLTVQTNLTNIIDADWRTKPHGGTAVLVHHYFVRGIVCGFTCVCICRLACVRVLSMPAILDCSCSLARRLQGNGSANGGDGNMPHNATRQAALLLDV